MPDTHRPTDFADALGNASVSTSLEAIKLPIISAKFTVKAASDDAQEAISRGADS